MALCGCATGGKTTQDVALGKRFTVDPVPSGKCRLIVCWPSDTRNASGIQPNISIQGVDVGVLMPMGFLDAVVEPGTVPIAAKYEDIQYDHTFRSATNVQATAGSEVYIIYDPAPRARYSVLTLGIPSISFAMSLRQVTTGQGRELALQTRRSTPN